MSATQRALIVGGGPAGAALAILLARERHNVTLLEKSSAAHDKMCGEFFSYEAQHYLANLGLDLAQLGAVSITHVRLVAHRIIATSALPFTALSLRRSVLDEALLTQAVHSGAEVLRGQRVDSLANHTVQISDGSKHTADEVFLATGKHDLRGYTRAPGKQNDLIAFKMYFALGPAQAAELAHHVELLLFPGGYGGLQLVAPREANLCVLIRRAHFAMLGGTWPALLAHMQTACPHLATRLAEATPLLAKPLALSAIPYGLLPPANEANVWRLGDQAAVIPSFTGDGMSIALHSAHLAAQMFLAGAAPADFHKKLRAQLAAPVQRATTISRLMLRAPALAQLVTLYPPALRALTRLTRVPADSLIASNPTSRQ